MEKQVPNLQLSMDLSSINPKKKTLKEELIGYNFLNENIQGYIRLEILTKILHPLRRFTIEKHNQKILDHVEESNFQLNLLQDSDNLNFEKFLELQKLLFIIKNLEGLVASFNFKHLGILSTLTHFQADHAYDLETSSLSLLPAMEFIPERKINRIHFYLKSIAYKILGTSDLPNILYPEDFEAYRISITRQTYPELLDLEFNIHSNKMLESYYFQNQFKLTYH